MKRATSLGLGATMLAILAACSGPASSPAPDASPPPAATAPPAATPADSQPATPQPAAKASAAPAEESKLEKVATLPPAGQLPSGKWVAGVNYRPLVPAQPTDAPPGKVEVVEVFWYGCPHCYALDPYIESWRKTKPAYIEFRRVPVTWQPVHQSHARLFYAFEALGKEDAVHNAVFAEMHDKKNFMYMQGDDKETLSAQLAFAKAHGISEADFTGAWNSFTVQTSMQKADELVHRYHVDGVPLLVINGKYVTDVNMAGSMANVMSIVSDLAASERPR
jgi:protein dithiol oxidoreductase (disulfide-forming)